MTLKIDKSSLLAADAHSERCTLLDKSSLRTMRESLGEQPVSMADPPEFELSRRMDER